VFSLKGLMTPFLFFYRLPQSGDSLFPLGGQKTLYRFLLSFSFFLRYRRFFPFFCRGGLLPPSQGHREAHSRLLLPFPSGDRGRPSPPPPPPCLRRRGKSPFLLFLAFFSREEHVTFFLELHSRIFPLLPQGFFLTSFPCPALL